MKMEQLNKENFNSRSRYIERAENQSIDVYTSKNTSKLKSLYHLFKQQNEQIMQSLLCPYKPAKLSAGPKYWYIYFSFRNPSTGQFERFKEYFDINRIHNRREKRIYAEEMVKFLNERLAIGFNPFEGLVKTEVGTTILQRLNFLFAEMSKNSNKSMVSYYNTVFNRLRRFLNARQLLLININDVTNLVAEDVKIWMIEEELAKKTINDTLSHMSLFWKKAIKLQLATADPFMLVDKVKKELCYTNDEDEEDDDDLFEPLTFEELQAIMSKADANYKRYLYCILYAWARPKEIRALKVRDINKEAGYIKFKKGNTKNDHGAFVQIVSPLMKVFDELDFSCYNESDYLFSDDYLPGVEPLSRLKPWRRWLKITVPLGISKKQYALKHTGNIEYLLQNKGHVDLKWQQMQNRHKTSAMTDRYNRKLGAYFIDEKNVKFREL